MITERTEIGVIALLADGVIQVRTDTVLERDGVELTRQYHRETLDPAVITDVSGKDERIRKIVELFWTPEVIAARVAWRARPENVGIAGGRPSPMPGGGV